jgi:hypothetical protein
MGTVVALHLMISLCVFVFGVWYCFTRWDDFLHLSSALVKWLLRINLLFIILAICINGRQEVILLMHGCFAFAIVCKMKKICAGLTK